MHKSDEKRKKTKKQMWVKKYVKGSKKMPNLMLKQSQNQQKSAIKMRFLQGFSLLELLVVIGLLGILATATTTMLIDNGEEKRKDATEKNWDAIRKAIIGDSALSLNGSPHLSGYVADMGRLPNNIKELMSQGASQVDWGEININPSGPDFVLGLSGTLHAGWRGPYLYTAGRSAFPDGWTDIRDLDVNDMNFGWDVTLRDASGTQVATAASATTVAVQSLSEGNQVGGADYGEDFPVGSGTMVDLNDWQANVSSVTFDLRFTSASSTVPSMPLKLVVYFIDDTTVEKESVLFNFPTVSGTTGTQNQQVILPTGGVGLPMGRYAVAILCDTGVSQTVYDGNCDGAVSSSKQAFYFTMLPNIQQVTIPWNTP